MIDLISTFSFRPSLFDLPHPKNQSWCVYVTHQTSCPTSSLLLMFLFHTMMIESSKCQPEEKSVSFSDQMMHQRQQQRKSDAVSSNTDNLMGGRSGMMLNHHQHRISSITLGADGWQILFPALNSASLSLLSWRIFVWPLLIFWLSSYSLEWLISWDILSYLLFRTAAPAWFTRLPTDHEIIWPSLISFFSFSLPFALVFRSPTWNSTMMLMWLDECYSNRSIETI